MFDADLQFAFVLVDYHLYNSLFEIWNAAITADQTAAETLLADILG